MNRLTTLVTFGIYVACIPLANWLVANAHPIPVGFSYQAPAGVLVAGIAFTVRDALQRVAGRLLAVLAIGAGVALSLLLAPPALALASGIAFAASESLDFLTYTMLERRGMVWAVAGSNVVGLIIDSALFLWLAFGSLAFLPGQILGKLWMTLAAIAILVPVRRIRAA